MYWYRFETKGIQRWILDPGKLRDVEGGSRLVERITEAAAGQIESAGGAVIQQAAGAVTATFSDRASLERFAGEWPMQFAYAAPGLRLVQAWSDAGGTLEQVFGRLAAARNLQSPEFPEASPWVKRSSRSGRPALHWSKVRSSADRVAPDRATIAREVSRRDSSETGKEMQGTVAVIHIDGTGIGQMLMQKAATADGLREFARKLTEAMSAATTAAASACGGEANFRRVVQGGDDVTVIVRGDRALTYVESWIRTFENATAAALGQALHAGAGVVFCSANYPFALAYDLAEALCKHAKDAHRDDGRSAFAMQRVTTSLAELDERRKVWVLDRQEAREALVTSIGKRDGIGVARGPLRTWLGLMNRGAATDASVLWSRTREVATQRSESQWKAFIDSLEQCGGDGAGGSKDFAVLRDVLALASVSRGATA